MAESASNSRPENRRRQAIRAAVRRPVHALRAKAQAARRGEAAKAAKGDPSATVFVSYSREDLEVVRPLVQRLRSGGVAVTWDQDFAAGTDFERWIRDSIDRVRSVIVVWSPASVLSAFVRDEARRALRTDKLITTHVDGFDVMEVPLGFGHLHVIPAHDDPGLRRSLAQRGVEMRA